MRRRGYFQFERHPFFRCSFKEHVPVTVNQPTCLFVVRRTIYVASYTPASFLNISGTWGVTLPEGYFDNAVGPEPFRETVKRFGGPDALEQWERLTAHLLKLSECTMGLPPFSLRTDPGAVVTMAPFLSTLFKVIRAGPRCDVFGLVHVCGCL